MTDQCLWPAFPPSRQREEKSPLFKQFFRISRIKKPEKWLASVLLRPTLGFAVIDG
jgi:hypothetical protein